MQLFMILEAPFLDGSALNALAKDPGLISRPTSRGSCGPMTPIHENPTASSSLYRHLCEQGKHEFLKANAHIHKQLIN